MRLGFAGLAGLVQQEMGRELVSGELFLFVSRRRTSAKILHWDGTGLCLYSKRLAGRRRFAALWERAERGQVRLTMAELALFLEGAEVSRRRASRLSIIR
ncbi:MAG: IS66 family insertion sequence element accessory protein TnpB [Alphaproteobacteria bacterium]|nr:IS66 family insertion sequence element accessory protein TnpB [Alphaproteobacteria bacterium]